MAKNNIVFGISATALFKTVILNFDLDYIKMQLKENVHLMSSQEATALLNEMITDYNIINNNVNIKISKPSNFIQNSHFFKIIKQKQKIIKRKNA